MLVCDLVYGISYIQHLSMMWSIHLWVKGFAVFSVDNTHEEILESSALFLEVQEL